MVNTASSRRWMLLDRHQKRRDRDQPAVSFLCCEPTWRQWAYARGFDPIVVDGAAAHRNQELVRSVSRRNDLCTVAAKLLSQALEADPDRMLRRATNSGPVERHTLRRQALASGLPAHLVTLAATLVLDQQPPPEQTPAADLLRLYPPRTGPAVCIDARKCNVDSLQKAGTWATQLSLAAPTVPVALIASEATASAYRHHAPRSRTRAMLLHGFVPTLEAIVSPRRGPNDPPAPDRDLLGDDVTETETSSTPEAPDTDLQRGADEEAQARSAAEQALYTWLQAHPQTRDKFALNGRLDVRFGNRPTEVDLLCATARLAVEIDGYWHFTDPDSFRRDRRKDVLLQEQGLLVTRVLAQDVMHNLQAVAHSVLDLYLRRVERSDNNHDSID